MSYVDLATLALHRRNEMETRINTFLSKCDRAITEISKLKSQAQRLVLNLNCEPSELKDRFLNGMKQLDEYIYLITDFNLAVDKLDEINRSDYMPVHDTSTPMLIPVKVPHPFIPQPFNIIDVLSEQALSSPVKCPNNCPSEQPKKKKIPKEDQCLIQFSSASTSSESVPVSKAGSIKVEKEIQCELMNAIEKVIISDKVSVTDREQCNLPAQSILQTDHSYDAVIMNIDGSSLWIVAEDAEAVKELMLEMTSYYKENFVNMSLEEVTSFTLCAFYDEETDCYYRALFIRLTEQDVSIAEVFLVDTGEVRSAPAVGTLQPLLPRFCHQPPYARCCHFAAVELINHHTKEENEKLEQFLKQYIGVLCTIEVDDNTSESLGVYVVLPNGQILNKLLVENGFAYEIPEKPSLAAATPTPSHGPPELFSRKSSEDDITNCPEYDDPVEAVMGYKCRDDADICKHYKGGPEKTCFKGTRCKKRHVVKHPDGWTLDRVPVVARYQPAPLPPPGDWLKVHVTCVAHFDRVFVHVVTDNEPKEELPSFGVVLPPTSLTALVLDMNSPATKLAYKPLSMAPAPGELVAALYPPDNQWYRATVVSATRGDQSVEVMYIDYGNVTWVKEDAVRELDPRYVVLPAQAVRCALAGVAPISHDSAAWARAKKELASMAQDRTLDAFVVARDYEEITVELYDEEGYNIAEQLSARNLVKLNPYNVIDDTNVKQKLVVP